MAGVTPADDLLMPAEVARLFGISAKTVTRWARSGQLPAVRTLGGHRRYRRDVVEAALAAGGYKPNGSAS